MIRSQRSVFVIPLRALLVRHDEVPPQVVFENGLREDGRGAVPREVLLFSELGVGSDGNNKL